MRQVWGLDCCAEMLALVKPPVRSVLGDVRQPPLPPAYFDVAWTANLLQILPDWPLMLRAAFEILRPMGHFVMLVTTPDQLRSRFINQFFPSLLALELVRYPAFDQIDRRLREVGFLPERVLDIAMEPVVVDENYLYRLETGIFSGLLMIDSVERETGMNELRARSKIAEESGRALSFGRVRSIVIARKHHS